MKKTVILLGAVIMSGLISSCGPSKEEIEARAKFVADSIATVEAAAAQAKAAEEAAAAAKAAEEAAAAAAVAAEAQRVADSTAAADAAKKKGGKKTAPKVVKPGQGRGN